MTDTGVLSPQLKAAWPNRVCLPYDVDLLQLARWIEAAIDCQDSSTFEIVAGDQSHTLPSLDAIELFCEIQRRCVNFDLSHSHVLCKQPKSVMYFDMYGRYCFFAADLPILRKLYPFSREIMRENFLLLQEADDDAPLVEVFDVVQSD